MAIGRQTEHDVPPLQNPTEAFQAGILLQKVVALIHSRYIPM